MNKNLPQKTNEVKRISLLILTCFIFAFTMLNMAQAQNSITGYNGPICQGQTVTLCAPTGFNTFEWNTGASTQCITVNSSGTYTVAVSNVTKLTTVGITLALPETYTQVVVVNPVTPISINGPSSICQGQTAALISTPGLSSYSWNTGSSASTLTIGYSGIYTVVGTNSFGCTSTASKTITVNPLPSFVISGASSICLGKTASLCAPTGYSSYTWNTGSHTECITPSSSGIYTVSVTNAQGCSSSAQKNLVVNSLPPCSISGSANTICSGQTVNLCGPSGSLTYQWSNGQTTRCNPVSTAGSYTITVTNSNGCSSSCNQQIMVNNVPAITIAGSNGTICQGQIANICATSGLVSYIWNTGETTPCISASMSGNYIVTAYNQQGCSATASKNITVLVPPVCTITGGNKELCEGETAELCAPTGSDSYLWNTGETTSCITVSAESDYSVTIANQSAINECPSHCSTSIFVSPRPSSEITGSYGFICEGSKMTLCAPPEYSAYHWNTGATTSCIDIIGNDSYSVKVTNSSGCTSSSSIPITMFPTELTITGGENPICQGQSASLCAPSGYTSYIWNNGQTSSCISVNSQGNYQVTVTNSYGCTGSSNRNLTVNTLPSGSITGYSKPLCPGQTITLSAPSGYTSYNWSTGASTKNISVNTAGNYTVTFSGASNGNNCQSSSSQLVEVETAPIWSISSTANSICSGSAAQLCAPAGFHSYLWNTGETSACINATSAGAYSAVVTTESGCSFTEEKSITVNQPVSISISGNNSICQGQSAQLCAPSGMSSYQWSNGMTTSCISANTAGSYSVSIVGENGCTSTASKVITVNTPPVNTISGNANICIGGEVQLCAATGMASYSWSNGATTSCIGVSSAGNYSATVTGANGCSSTASKILTSSTPPVCSISGNTTICGGGSVQLCATPGMASYSWSNGATTSCINASSAGNYSVTIIDANGCSNTASKTLTTTTLSPFTITGNTTICTGGVGQLCVPSGMASYLWSNGANASCINVSAAGNYSVTITNESGCTSTSSKTINSSTLPACTISGNTTICSGGSIQLCAPSGMNSYSWSNGANTSCINVNAGGNYSVSITDANGCPGSGSKSVISAPAAVCTIAGNTTICAGGVGQLCAPSGMSSYMWNNGATTTCINASAAGNYSVTVTGEYGCTSTAFKTITSNAPPACSITGNAAICAGGSVQLCAPTGMTSYSWSSGATTSCITANAAGNYTVSVSDANGCSGTSTKTIAAINSPACVITGNTSICGGGTSQLCAPTGMTSYLWNNGTAASCISVSTGGNYTVTITGANGCTSTASKAVTASTQSACTITGSNAVCSGGSAQLCAASGMTSYSWNTGETTMCINVTAAGNYSVTGTNASGCTSTGSKTLTIDPCNISLTITPNKCEIIQGTTSAVTLTYVVTNNSSTNSASGNLVDDNGTYSNTADDINIGNWGPLAPGASATFTRTITISGSYINVAKASGIIGGSAVTAYASATISGLNCSCSLTYPDNSNPPRSGVVFNEPQILAASDPGPQSCGTNSSVIKLWYMDEHAMTLGIKKVNVKTKCGITTTNYPITPTPAAPTCIEHPLVGTTISSGDFSGNDVSAGDGRPIWPALFVTDLTLNGPESRAGDWQQGGIGIPPSKVCGTWKGAVKLIDKTYNPAKITVTPDPNPAKNHWNLGSGDIPPGGIAQYQDEGYGAEVTWNVNELGLIAGHTYRLQFMVHDGDQNKTGGDCGESCTTIKIPGTSCASTLGIGSTVWTDVNANGMKDPSESGIANITMNLYTDNNNDNVSDGAAISTTKTDATGTYKFNSLSPGNYIVGAAVPSGKIITTINGGDPDNDIDNDNNGMISSNSEVRSKSISIAIGTEPINDGDGSNNNQTIDFGFTSSTPQTSNKCYVGSSHNYVTAMQSWTINSSSQTVTIHTVLSKNFADNTYGNNCIGWSGQHTFNDMCTSDKLQIACYDINNTKKMEFAIDYLSASTNASSGYRSLGVTGGDGTMILGSASDVVSCKSSMDKNLNDFSYVLLTNSPSTTASYNINNNYPNWIFDVWYDVTIKLSAFPNGFGEPAISGVNASPSKIGCLTEVFNKVPCGNARLKTPKAPETRSINAYVFPNPTNSITNITFQLSNNEAYTNVEIFNLQGRKIATLFDGIAEPDNLYKLEFNTEGMEKGIYIYKITSGENIINGKLMLIK